MSHRTLIAGGAGSLFGAGLSVSGMVDPTRVRSFLDIMRAWDPTLAFVMAGALIPMAAAWRLRSRRSAPVAETAFHMPDTRPITPRLLMGALIFGVGWGLSGLCPGPAIADVALVPRAVLPFVAAMIAGFALHRLFDRIGAAPLRPGPHAMSPKSLSPDFWASPQLSPDNVTEIASSGFGSIINARPDGEEDEQPTSAQIEEAARRTGLRYAHIPVVPGHIDDAAVRAFATAFRDAPKPVLGFCRSGTRAANLWALAMAAQEPTDTILKSASAVGYDLSGLRERMGASAVTRMEGAPIGSSVARSTGTFITDGDAGALLAETALDDRHLVGKRAGARSHCVDHPLLAAWMRRSWEG